jgi:hypothetical protein
VGLAVTATSLVAMVAAASAVPSPGAAGVGPRLESHVVRSVAAAVAAVARDLVGAEQTAMTAALLDPSPTGADPSMWRPLAPPEEAAAPPSLLGERLLDLPPPTC